MIYNVKIFILCFLFLVFSNEVSIAQDYLIVTASLNTVLDDGVNQTDIVQYQKIESGDILFKESNSLINLRCSNNISITILSEDGLHDVKKIINICKGNEVPESHFTLGDMFISKSNTKGMSLSQDKGTSRSLFGGDNIVDVGLMRIIDGHNFKLDATHIIDSLGLLGHEYTIRFTDASSGNTVLDTTTLDTYLVKKLPFLKNFLVYWNFEVSISNSDKIIKGIIEEQILDDPSQEILDGLHNEIMIAISENDKEIFASQVLFIQHLVSEGLFATAHYYLDSFIQDSKYSEELGSYRDYLLYQ